MKGVLNYSRININNINEVSECHKDVCQENSCKGKTHVYSVADLSHDTKKLIDWM
jgi:hypothetical protein